MQRWAEARVTRDIDITLLTGFGQEEQFIDALLSRYAPRSADAKGFALKNRVLLLVTQQSIGIDVSLAALPFEQSAIERASLHTFAPGYTMSTCSAEDLMVFKLFASRARISSKCAPRRRGHRRPQPRPPRLVLHRNPPRPSRRTQGSTRNHANPRPHPGRELHFLVTHGKRAIKAFISRRTSASFERKT